MKRWLNPLRIAAVLLVLYCAGHTSGALLSTPSFGPASDAVATAMKTVRFAALGSDCSWFGFYEGFGWAVSIFFLFSAFVAWVLGGIVRNERRPVASVVWALFLSQFANAILAFKYFFLPPMIFSTAITVLLGIECVLVSRAARSAGSRAAVQPG
jgi:hypothetical protein